MSQYSADGQLLFQQDSATGLGTNYIYLAGSLVAFREQLPGMLSFDTNAVI